jgi:hypothetical protein
VIGTDTYLAQSDGSIVIAIDNLQTDLAFKVVPIVE